MTGSLDKWCLILACAVTVIHLGVQMRWRPVKQIIDDHAFKEESSVDRNAWTVPQNTTDWQVRRIGAYAEWFASRVRPQRPCLLAALAASRLMHRRGYSSVLVLGVRRATRASLEAHAWLLHDAHCVTGRRDSFGFSAVSFLSSGIHQ